MKISLAFLFLVGSILTRPQQGCDPIFDDDCTEVTDACDPDDIFCGDDVPGTPVDCFDSTNEIEQAIFNGDTRQAFNDCDPTNSCEKYSGEGYVCAPSWTCKNNTIITDGKGIIDVRSGFDGGASCAQKSGTLDASDRKCENVDYVCCKNPNFRATKCPVIERPKTTKDPYTQCGRSSSNLKITGLDDNSLDAQPGEFTHMCVIYRFEQGQRIYVAGASLIAKNKILTVAHKFYVIQGGKTTDWRKKTDNFYVRCGEHNVKTDTELLDSQETQVERVIIHPQYDAKRVYFNLAIIQTKENFVYQEHIGPVCLPKPFENFANDINCWSSGWGADAYDSLGQFSDSLKKVKMPIVSNEECETRMKNTDRFKNKPGFQIHNSWICVGGEKGSDTCKGDGGSPHVCKNSDDRWVQVGAVAWGVGCGTEVPAVYSSIPEAMCWVDWVMSCIPDAQYNIDNTFVDDLDIRGTTRPSKNKLTTADCGEWMVNNSDLRNTCEVEYQDVDTRSGK